MNKAAQLVDLKCKLVCIFSDEKIEQDYLIDNCVDFEDRELKIKEYSLLINFLENEHYLDEIPYCPPVEKPCKVPVIYNTSVIPDGIFDDTFDDTFE